MICGDAQGSVWGGGGEGCGEVGAGAGPEAGHSQDRGPGALRIPHQVSIVIHSIQASQTGPFTLLQVQCCGSGMIYFGSGSSYEFLEFLLRILPILFKHIWRRKKIKNQKEESSNYLPFSFSPYSPDSTYWNPESSGHQIISKILIYTICCVILVGSGKSLDSTGPGSTTLDKSRKYCRTWSTGIEIPLP